MAAPTRQNDTAITRWTPAAELDRISQELSRLWDEQWSLAATAGRDGFIPLADLEETDDSYVLDVELPGVQKKDINVETDGRRLVVSGERKEERRAGRLRRRSRTWGEFRYEVVLPDEVDEEHVEATMNDGVLHLRAPKRTADTQRRRIEVT
jgi:HSP20 family protein